MVGMWIILNTVLTVWHNYPVFINSIDALLRMSVLGNVYRPHINIDKLCQSTSLDKPKNSQIPAVTLGCNLLRLARNSTC